MADEKQPAEGSTDEFLNPSKRGPVGKNEITSNSPAKKPVPSEELELERSEKRTPSTSGPKGTEEPGSDEGPGGTGW
ncbi:MAG TPA: hypothetical protein V6C76_14855 [Drouetiella sp.]